MMNEKRTASQGTNLLNLCEGASAKWTNFAKLMQLAYTLELIHQSGLSQSVTIRSLTLPYWSMRMIIEMTLSLLKF
jgi:hypothetical protein